MFLAQLTERIAIKKQEQDIPFNYIPVASDTDVVLKAFGPNARAAALRARLANAQFRAKTANSMGAHLHEAWRSEFHAQKPAEASIPRMRDKGEGKVDINQPWDKLHPSAQKENHEAGKAAVEAVRLHPNNMEKAAEHVHNEWMKRNPKDDYNAASHVPYNQLHETAQGGKEADRAHIRIAQKLIAKS